MPSSFALRPAHRPEAGSRSCARTASPGSTSPSKVRKSAAPHRRAWSRSPPCRGSAARRPRPPPRRRSPRTAAAPPRRSPRRADRAMCSCASAGSATVDREVLAQRLTQRDRQRQPGKARPADQHVDAFGHALCLTWMGSLLNRAHLDSNLASVLIGPSCEQKRHMSSAVQDLARRPRPRTARGESVPRPLAAGRLAARVRRPGDRPGAGRRGPHGR